MHTNVTPNEQQPRKLGLIGNGIQRSSAPRLHRLAASLCDLALTYDLIDLQEQDPANFETVLAQCAADGYWGVNVTYPFKERAAKVVEIPSPVVQQIGAVNTVIFGDGQSSKGYNTDYTGFLRAYQQRFPNQAPGVVGIVGTGGVGRPVAFGLAQLGARELRLYDLDTAKALALAKLIQQTMPQVLVQVCPDVRATVEGVDGLVNCTPVGMYQHPGTPLPPTLIQHQRWAFDVIYTPLETEFLAAAHARGLAVMRGYELFFYQGVDAFAHFTGRAVAEEPLRQALASSTP